MLRNQKLTAALKVWSSLDIRLLQCNIAELPDWLARIFIRFCSVSLSLSSKAAFLANFTLPTFFQAHNPQRVSKHSVSSKQRAQKHTFHHNPHTNNTLSAACETVEIPRLTIDRAKGGIIVSINRYRDSTQYFQFEPQNTHRNRHHRQTGPIMD